MQCVTPMIRMYQDYTFEEKQAIKNAGGKQFNHIISRSEVQEKLRANENYFTYIERKNDELIKQGSKLRYGTVPCKKCWACRLNYSMEWAVRIMHECSKTPDMNYFVTLTYDDKHIPVKDYIEYHDQTGNKQRKFNNGCFKPSLEPQDFTRFINSLRKYIKREYNHDGIKYYMCGEYGETTHRPHMHIILMNIPLKTEKFYDFHEDSSGNLHWKTKEIEDQWKKGMIDVAKVEMGSAAYVARYGTKLFINGGTEEDYAQLGMVKEFTRSSRRPAIGLDYLKSHELDMLETDEILTRNTSGSKVHVKLPAYYQKKLEETYPEYINQVKKERQLKAINANKLKRTKTNLTDREMYERQAQELARRGGLLKRSNLDDDIEKKQKESITHNK